MLLCGAATPTEPVCVLTHPPSSRLTLGCGTVPGWLGLSCATLTSVTLFRLSPGSRLVSCLYGCVSSGLGTAPDTLLVMSAWLLFQPGRPPHTECTSGTVFVWWLLVSCFDGWVSSGLGTAPDTPSVKYAWLLFQLGRPSPTECTSRTVFVCWLPSLEPDLLWLLYIGLGT